MAKVEVRPGKSRGEADRGKRQIDRQKPGNLREWHELGTKTLALFPQGAGRHTPTIERTADELKITKDLVLKAVVFARTFSPEELQTLCDLRTPSGKSLTFSHVRRVLSVESREKRSTLLARTAREGWSNEDLSSAVIAEQGGPKSKGGKRPSRPRTPEEALRQITARTEEWLRRCEKSWEDGTGPLATAVKVGSTEVRKLRAPLEQARTALVRLRGYPVTSDLRKLLPGQEVHRNSRQQDMPLCVGPTHPI